MSSIISPFFKAQKRHLLPILSPNANVNISYNIEIRHSVSDAQSTRETSALSFQIILKKYLRAIFKVSLVI